MKDESIQNLCPGDRFDYAGLEWVVLDSDKEGGVLAITAELYYDEIEFGKQDFNGCNDWSKSSLREQLQNDFLSLLGEDNLRWHTVDLVADNGDTLYGTVRDKVFLLTYNEYLKYRELIPQYNHWMWTCTPYITTDISYASTVCSVNSEAFFNVRSACHAIGGAAPACIFNPWKLKLRRQNQFVKTDN